MGATMPTCRICGVQRPAAERDIVPRTPRDEIAAADPTSARTTVRICRTCCAAADRAFEDEIAPLAGALVHGEPLELDPAYQAAIGQWAMKAALLATLRPRPGAADDELELSRREYRRRALHYLIHVGGMSVRYCSVRLAVRAREEDPEAVPDLDELRPFVPWDRTPPFAHSFGGLLMVGNLVAEVVLAEADLGEFVRETPDDDRAVRVWPYSSRPKAWPPAQLLRTFEIALWRWQWGMPVDGTGRVADGSPAA